MAVAKEYGGEGTDYVTQALVMAELARGDSSISKTFSQNWKWSHLIQQACNEEQKERFLRPFVADHRFLLGKGITEPTAGSDNRLPPKDAPKAGLKLRAERKGDEWILNGEKCFIANAPVGKLFFIDARTDPNAPLRQGTTMFLVPSDTPGFRIGKVFNKSGWRFYRNGEMIFENARVPHANVVGNVNTSDMKTAQAGDRTGGDLFGDLELAANALGVCDDACEQAMKHAKTAKQGGQPLIEQQHIALKLNKMNMLTEALRSYVMRIAWEHDHKVHSANAGLAMNFSTDVIQEVTEINLDIQAAPAPGARHAEKLVRDSVHLEPSRRRQRAAAEGGEPPRPDDDAGALNHQLSFRDGAPRPTRNLDTNSERVSGFRVSPASRRRGMTKRKRTMDTKDLAAKGLKLRKEMVGAANVEQRINALGEFGEPLQNIINAYAYGDVWSRPGLSMGTKSLAMIAMMAAANKPAELRVHLKGALKNGCTPEEIREVLLLVALYCGIPAANEAHRAAVEVLKEEQKI